MMIGTSEVTVWRWEKGEAHPEAGTLRLIELMKKDRKKAMGLLSEYVLDRLKE